MYDDWDEYGIRCLQHSGPHWKHDNSDMWQIISRLIRDGPGWDYIQSCGTSTGKGNGRQAYLQIKQQAYQYSNVRMNTNEAFSKLRALRFDGNTKHFTYDVYVRRWLLHRKTLKEHHECPEDKRHVQEFCEQITDPRLDNPIDIVLAEDSIYLNNFDKMHRFLNQSLATKQSRASNCKTRNISSFNKKGKSKGAPSNTPKFSGTIEAKRYTKKEWFSMTKEQRQKVKDLFQANGSGSKRQTPDAPKPTSIPNDDAWTITQSSTNDAGNQFGRTAHKKAKFANNA